MAYNIDTLFQMKANWTYFDFVFFWGIQLYESCNEPSLLKSVHGSYMTILELYRKRCDRIADYCSDLPRELACMQMSMMDERRETIENLTSQYKQCKLFIQTIKAELDKRPVDTEWDISDY